MHYNKMLLIMSGIGCVLLHNNSLAAGVWVKKQLYSIAQQTIEVYGQCCFGKHCLRGATSKIKANKSVDLVVFDSRLTYDEAEKKVMKLVDGLRERCSDHYTLSGLKIAQASEGNCFLHTCQARLFLLPISDATVSHVKQD